MLIEDADRYGISTSPLCGDGLTGKYEPPLSLYLGSKNRRACVIAEYSDGFVGGDDLAIRGEGEANQTRQHGFGTVSSRLNCLKI